MSVLFGGREGNAADDKDEHQRSESIADYNHRYGKEPPKKGNGIGIPIPHRAL